MYKFVDCVFNRESLIALFSNSVRGQVKSLYQVTEPLVGNQCIDEVFEQFDFIANNNHNVELGELSSYVPPYISPGNNGLLVIPLIGTMSMNFYSYVGDRETMSPYRTITIEEFREIKSRHIETVVIDRPVIFNGLIVHDYRPVDRKALIAIFKIPLDVSWEYIEQWCARRDSNPHLSTS